VTAIATSGRQIPPGITCHYHAKGRHYGVNEEGHDVLWDEKSGKLTRLYTPKQQRESERATLLNPVNRQPGMRHLSKSDRLFV